MKVFGNGLMTLALACVAIPGVAQITLDNDFADWASIPTAGTVSTNTLSLIHI